MRFILKKLHLSLTISIGLSPLGPLDPLQAETLIQAGVSQIQTSAVGGENLDAKRFSGQSYRLSAAWQPFQPYLSLTAALERFFLYAPSDSPDNELSLRGSQASLGVDAGFYLLDIRPSLFWSKAVQGSMERVAEGGGDESRGKLNFTQYGVALEWMSFLGIGLQCAFERSAGFIAFQDGKRAYAHEAWRVGAGLRL